VSQLHCIAVVDTETTGLYPSRDRLVEIAIMLLEVERGTGRLVQVLDRYEGLQDPGMPMPPEAMAVHGITDAMVKGQRIDEGRVAAILARADLVVAHNSGFDKGFVRQVLPQADTLVWGCSCRGIPWRRLYPAVENTRLQHLASRLAVAAGTAHRAMGDVETTVNLVLLPDALGNAHLLHLITRKLPGPKPVKVRVLAAR
jgi:DNA polymerase-3 subunit epsilon